MKFDEMAEKRHSVRKFTKKIPSWKDISLAINAARLAPLAGNIPNLKFIAVFDEKIIGKLADAANQDWIKFAKCVVITVSNDESLVLSYGERGKKYARQQSGAAIENFMLKLEDLGLVTCWVGAFLDEEVKKILKVPDNLEIEAILPVGYEEPKAKGKQKPKPDLSTRVYWGEWENAYLQKPKKQEI